MASTSNTTTTYGSDPASPNTTFVQADPSTFRTIVQQLTGAPEDPSTQKLPLTHPIRPSAIPGLKRPAFKLQERRQSTKNLQINLNNNISFDHHHHHDMFQFSRQRGFLVSPVSTLDFLAAHVSPRSPCEECSGRGSPRDHHQHEEEGEGGEEERTIAEKGFYLHPSPLSMPRGRGAKPPELLPLFPLKSPTDNDHLLLHHHDDGDGEDSSSCS